MQQSRRELVDQVLRLVGETDDDDARTLAEDLFNTAMLRIWMKHPWKSFRTPNQFTFTTTANTGSYPLPHYFGRIPPTPSQIRNLSVGTLLTLVSQDDVQAEFPTQGTSLEIAGTPARCFIGGSVGVGVQPSSAGDALEVVSTSAADVTVRVTIEGLDANGRENRTQVTLNGVAAVAVGTWTQVIAFSKAYPDGTDPTTERTSSAGNVTLQKAGGGTVLQVLLPIESACDRPQITLHPKPDDRRGRSPCRCCACRAALIYDSDMVSAALGSRAAATYMLRFWRVSTGEIAEEGGSPIRRCST
jgi:hypothetical protein